jgi:hypothetical protein
VLRTGARLAAGVWNLQHRLNCLCCLPCCILCCSSVPVLCGKEAMLRTTALVCRVVGWAAVFSV